MEDVKPKPPQLQNDPIQFGLVPLFFLTAFFAALVMIGVEGYQPRLEYVPNWPGYQPQPLAGLSAKGLAYAGLAFIMAVATVASMVRPRKHAAPPGDQPANSLAPENDIH
jgi:hypothetical protein